MHYKETYHRSELSITVFADDDVIVTSITVVPDPTSYGGSELPVLGKGRRMQAPDQMPLGHDENWG